MITRYNAPWIIAYKSAVDGQDGGHRLLRDGCVVVQDDRILYVGQEFNGHVDATVNTESVIAPGFVSTHAHLQESPVDKSLAEDSERRQFYSSTLADILPPKAMALDVQGQHASVTFSIAELLLSGCTTVLQMGSEAEFFAEQAERHGIRAYVGHSYRSGRWLTRDGKRVEYEWDERAGWEGFQHAVDLADSVNLDNGRIQGAFYPAQVDTCTEDLLMASAEAATERGLPVTTHAAQSVFEFQEMTQRHGRTPVEWLYDIGFLAHKPVLGHVIFTTGNSWVNFPGDDLGLLAETGATVAYNAWVFARNGIALESFKKYRDRGVRISLGTDTVAQSMIESCRWTSVIGKIIEKHSHAVTAGEVFAAATIEGAEALGRTDLGRICEQAKADLVFWRTDTLSMQPLRDPIRNIVYYAQPTDVETVLVDGKVVVDDGAVPTIDVKKSAAAVQDASERIWERWPQHDWAGRGVEEHFPLSYPRF
ncbi:amidohydrolase [Nesterenkonia salmonea]|uniref:Amidohydrolase n=1 Tax=Nesterenkonia salmonea TaxID=1804987 RepID=A0A5R9BK40_9MICC|nr:amidohydrolase family protein [Nesterenkonia salmonea]TLQ01044.1 amidohydrolase [Nesterenkonia salmonea]